MHLVDQRIEDRKDPGAWPRASSLGGGAEPLLVQLRGALHVGGDEVVLGGEESVERGGSDLRLRGDGVDAGGPDALPIEQLVRDGQDVLTGLGGGTSRPAAPMSTITELPAGDAPPRASRLALPTLTFAAFVIGTAELVVVGILELIAGDTGASISTAGNLVTAYALGIAVGAPIIAAVTARFGRRSVLQVAFVVFLVGNLVAVVAASGNVAIRASDRQSSQRRHGRTDPSGVRPAGAGDARHRAADLRRSVHRIHLPRPIPERCHRHFRGNDQRLPAELRSGRHRRHAARRPRRRPQRDSDTAGGQRRTGRGAERAVPVRVQPRAGHARLGAWGLAGFAIPPALLLRVVILAGGSDQAATLGISASNAGIAAGSVIGGAVIAGYGAHATVLVALIITIVALPATWATRFLDPTAPADTEEIGQRADDRVDHDSRTPELIAQTA